MKKVRSKESQIFQGVKEAEARVPVSELCRKYGMSSAWFYKWRAKYGGMGARPAFPQITALNWFRRQAVQNWLEERHVDTHYIDPGNPWQNAYNESLNSISSHHVSRPLAVLLDDRGSRNTTPSARMGRLAA